MCLFLKEDLGAPRSDGAAALAFRNVKVRPINNECGEIGLLLQGNLW